jgi:hypothetical protein
MQASLLSARVLLVIADIVRLANLLDSLQDSFSCAERQRRDRLASYLQQISACLDDALDDLRSGGGAVRACGQLHQYVELIPLTVDEVLGAEQAQRLLKGLRAALCVRGLPKPSSDELNQLNEAAAAFAALGSYLRVSA